MPSEKITERNHFTRGEKSEVSLVLGTKYEYENQVQCALIDAMYEGKDNLSANNLQSGLEDVLKRRGMAYKSTPNLAQN